MRFLSWRAIFLISFVIAMPILALPPVARRIDELLYGAPPKDFGRPPSPPPTVTELAPPKTHVPKANELSHALYDEASPAARAMQPAAYVANDSPPLLAPTPQFEPIAPPRPSQVPPESPIDEQTVARLQQIRERLERLGADYVVVESQDGGRYRFHCRMLVDDRSRFTRPFEASALDPVAAGVDVLREVESWRAATPTQPRRLPE